MIPSLQPGDEEPSGGEMKRIRDLTLLRQQLRALVEEMKRFLQASEAPGIPDEVRLTLLFSVAEIASAIVIAVSSERKLRAILCKMRSSRRVNRALAILRRDGVISHEDYERLRRVLRALRCHRNAYLHPICVERCPPLSVDEARRCVEELAALALRYASRED
ncbi:MAG: hypothetical protein GXO32_01335 [Crenarchaeota archaeon]|nr:hypothetical protein [Thermoproteota archaeon]